MRKTAVLVAFEGVQLLDVAGPADVLYAATTTLAFPADERHALASGTDIVVANLGASAEGHRSVARQHIGQDLGCWPSRTQR